MGDALLSIGAFAGFGVALGLQLTGRGDLARYVDPAMVVLTSAIYLRIPLRLAVEGLREVLTMSAVPAMREQVSALVDEVAREWGLAEPAVRQSKVGTRLDVDIMFLVDAGSTARSVEEFDRVRAQLEDRLRATGLEPSLSVGFTADPRWVA
jgi:predicted Co/Zn/Cd cation transporter (cation efflux family)